MVVKLALWLAWCRDGGAGMGGGCVRRGSPWKEEQMCLDVVVWGGMVTELRRIGSRCLKRAGVRVL